MNSFVDTNVSIAYTFRIDPFNNNSVNAFEDYDLIFWSNFVKEEFNKVFISKKDVLVRFYKKLLRDLKEDKNIKLTLKNLMKYVKNGNYIEKEFKQIESSLNVFWTYYVNESFPSYDSIESAINNCLKDLNISAFSRKVKWENNSKLTNKRINKYYVLNNKLDEIGVHFPDNEIILDAHDHNINNDYELDFVTFDRDCFNGAKLKDFCFHDVKSNLDFTF